MSALGWLLFGSVVSLLIGCTLAFCLLARHRSDGAIDWENGE